MADKKNKLTPVTDTDLLEAEPISASKPPLQPIVDADLLQAEEITNTPSSQKKSPVQSENGLAAPSQDGQSISSKTDNSTNYLANDVVANISNLPATWQQNANNIPFTQLGNVVHDVTDPHGNPEFTGGYLQTRLAQLDKDHAAEKQQAIFSVQNNPNADPSTIGNVDAKYIQQKQDLQNSAQHLIQLQLFNKAHTNNDYDITKLGIQYQKSLGSKQAAQDEILYDNSKKINPLAKLYYQRQGQQIIDIGGYAAKANGQDAIGNTADEQYIKANAKIEQDNTDVLRQARAAQIANYIYKNENPVYGTLFTHELTDKDISTAGKALGISYKDIKPEDVPSSLSVYGQAAKGLLNSGAPIYEGAMRGLAALGIANQDAVNEHFQPGWENKSGIASVMGLGETPEGQNDLSHPISNTRGFIGTMAKGVGDLAGFVGQAETGAGLLGKLGADATKAEKLANYATAAVPAYNSAYQNSLRVIGDDPDDEGKRQLYSTINGIVGGAFMLIDPKTGIAADILGETKAGKDFTKLIKNEGIEGLTKPVFQSKIQQVIEESAKHVGLQATIGGGSKMAENITDMVFNPKGDAELTSGVGQAAITSGISMLLPSIAAGINAPHNQTSANKNMMWEVGTNPYDYKKEIGNLYQSGKMSQDDATKATGVIDQLQHIISNQVPDDNIAGNTLTDEQKSNYAWNLLQTNELNKRLTKVEGLNDEAQTKSVTSEINRLAKEREDILNDAGKSELPVKPRLVLPEEKEEEKEEEKLAETKNNNIPLSSKTSENEQDENEVQNNDKTIDNNRQEINTERESDENGEIRNETGQGRPLKPEEENKEQEAQKEPSALLSKKPKRKYVEEEETPGEIPIKVEPDLQTQDLGTVKGQSESKTEDAVKKATIEHPDKPADVLFTNKPEGESFNDAKNRVKEAWDNISKPESEGGVKDNTLVMTHSWVMKLLNAAHKLGSWDHPDIESEHQKGSTETGEMESYTTEDGRTILVARHGETEDNLNDKQRTDDTPLTDKGREQALELAKQLKEKGITPPQIITSDLPRAKETAEIISNYLKSDNDATKNSDKPQQEINQQSGEPEYPRISAQRNGEAQPQTDNSDSGIGGTEKPEEVESEHVKRSKEIDDQLIKEKAVLKQLQTKRDKADKEGDVESGNDFNKKVTTKQNKIDKLNAEKAELAIKSKWNDIADRIESRYEKNKKAHENITASSLLGLSTKIGDHVADFVVSNIVKGIRELGNLHAAIHRAINEAKEKFGEDAKGLSFNDIDKIKENIGVDVKPQDKEPVLNIYNEEIAKDEVADILKGKPYNDVRDGIMNDDELSYKTKAKILNYIDWHINDQVEHNAVILREPEEKDSFVNNFSLESSGIISKLISGETIKDIYGDDPLNDPQTKIKTDLSLLASDGNKIIALAKYHFGENVVDYGGAILGQADKLPEGETVKRIASLTALMTDLHNQKNKLEYDLSKLGTTNDDNITRAEITKRLAEIPRLIKGAEKSYQVTQSNASSTLNAGRNMRKLFTGEYAKDKLADQAVLDVKQQKSKSELENSESNTKISDKIVKEGIIRKPEDADKQIKEQQKLQHQESEVKQKQKDKSKNITEKIKELATKKKAKEDQRIVDLKKEALQKLGVEPEKFLERLKDKINKIKC